MDFWFYQLLPALLVAFLFLIGFLGTFLPIIPGPIIVWIAILIDKLWPNHASVTWNFFWLATALTLLTQVTDWLCTYWGVKKFGGSWRGALGAIIGLIIGPFILAPIPLLGLLLGPIVGAILGELLGGMHWRHASKASFGTIIGGLIAFVIKIAIVSFMIIGFYFS